MFITLDYNCIIALEKNEEPNASTLTELIALCKREQIPVYVYSYLPLENPRKNGERLDLKKTLEAVGQGHIQARGREMIWSNDNGVPMYDPAAEQAFLHWVHHTMFPNIDFDRDAYFAVQCKGLKIPYSDMLVVNWDRRSAILLSPNKPIVTVQERLDAPTIQKYREYWEKWDYTWNNKKSDSLALCAHLSWGDGIFVTSNTSDFQKKASKLLERIPSLKILTPEKALNEVSKLVGEEQASSA